MTRQKAWAAYEQLDEIVTKARRDGDRVGYFAALYRAVAEREARGVDTPGFFHAPAVQARVSELFFERYRSALEAGTDAPEPWRTVFAAGRGSELTLLQHLLAAANAHINHDLPIVLSEVVTPESRTTYEPDFQRMNEVFNALLPAVFEMIAADDPRVRRIARVSAGGELVILDFSMRQARDHAWRAGKLRSIVPPFARSKVDQASAALCASLESLILSSTGAAFGEGDPQPEDVQRNIDLITKSLDAVPRSGRRRVAIVGGGMGALATAFCLTDPRNPVSKDVEVTIYQMGWRLGGKAATGRNTTKGYGHRVQEHGLHAFFGFYENTFRLLFDVFRTRLPAPFARWTDAFERIGAGVYWDPGDDPWSPWPINAPVRPGNPGEGGIDAPCADTFRPARLAVEALRALADRILAAPIVADTKRRVLGVAAQIETSEGVAVLAETYAALAEELGDVLQSYWTQLDMRAADPEKRHAWILLHFGLACVRGALASGLLVHGFDRINDYDFRAWLSEHAVDDRRLMLDSVLMRAVYEASFAFVGGDSTVADGRFPEHAEMEAGTALRGVARAALRSRGGFAFKLRAGTGDTVVGPLYQVLRDRKVKFRFFRCFKGMTLSPGGDRVETLTFSRQAIVAAEANHGEYRPLISVKELECWPDRPDYAQLIDGDALRDVDMEDPDAHWPQLDDEVLTRGPYFDDVVLAIPPDAARGPAAELARVSRPWREMFATIRSVGTQAMQVWLSQAPETLGLPTTAANGQPMTLFWNDPNPGLNVFSDYRAVLSVEDWPTDGAPRAVIYHCSTLPDGDTAEHVRRNGIAVLEDYGWRIYGDGIQRRPFDWGLLVPQPTGSLTDERCFATQYWRANVSPSERYVLSLRGTSAARVPSHTGDVRNLFAAGDWTRTILSCGCMEATVTSGMECASAMTGWPTRAQIVGVDDGI